MLVKRDDSQYVQFSCLGWTKKKKKKKKKNHDLPTHFFFQTFNSKHNLFCILDTPIFISKEI